jgi:hypothetical protein
MVGMGIGSFVDGAIKGYGLREAHLDRERARKHQDEDRAFLAEQRDWARSDQAYEAGERQRQTQNRDAISDINTEARTAFEAEVATGAQKPEDFDKFWKDYALPRMQDELLSQGDIEGYRKLSEWADSEDAKKGGRLFAGAMFKANMGDVEGALDDVIAAGKLGGYIAGDFDIDEKEPIVDESGATIGFRITIRDNDGNETVQDVALDDVPNVIATFANPQAAWESQQAAAADRTKRDNEFDDWKRKEDYKTENDAGAREDAIKSLRERIAVDPLVDGSVNFDDLPREEREKMIEEEIAFQKGSNAGPAVPAARTIVDNSTGQAVPMPDPAALEAAPGLGSVPRATPGGAQPGGAVPQAEPRRGNAVINGVEDPGLPAVSTPAELVDQAAQKMVEGGNPQEIARMLRATNVDEAMWPAELKRILSTSAPPA